MPKEIPTFMKEPKEPKSFPDGRDLFDELLTWDIEAPLPPKRFEFHRINQVKDRYTLASDYTKTFKPLLFLECWASIKKEMDILESKESIDRFVLKYVKISKKHCGRTFTFEWHEKQASHFLNRDFIIEIKNNSGTRIIGLITRIDNRGVFPIVSVQEFSKSTRFTGDLTLCHHLRVKVVFNLSTILREYQSLLGIGFIPLSSVILNSLNTRVQFPVIDLDASISGLNTLQSSAVLQAVNQRDGFVLVQGTCLIYLRSPGEWENTDDSCHHQSDHCFD